MFGKRTNSHYTMQAYNLAETIKLKELGRLLSGNAIFGSSSKLVYQEGDAQFFFVYRFGSIVFFNITPERQRQILEKVKMIAGKKPETIISEEFGVDVDSGAKNSVGFEYATIDELSVDRVELMSLVLALSTAMEFFEERVDDMLMKTGDIGKELKAKGRLFKGVVDIKKFIGQCIVTKQDLVASLYILDKPDETWDDPVLDKLYREAADMFELRERYRTMDYKLRMTQENLELIADMLQYRHANFLEWAIIALIAIEVVLFVWDLFILK